MSPGVLDVRTLGLVELYIEAGLKQTALTTLAASVGEEPDTVEDVVEPYLIELMESEGLWAPVLLAIQFSFNNSRSRTIWAGFSTRWYTFDPDSVRDLKASATADLTIGGAHLAAHAFGFFFLDDAVLAAQLPG